jgi:glutaredoxin
MKSVVLYEREGCCLCEEALAVLERVRARMPFGLVQFDIESDERVHRAYVERIPVVTIDGVEAFQYHVDEDELVRRLSEEQAA